MIFFKVYGIGQPLNSEIMCMRLEDQPDTKHMSMPLYRSDFFRVIHLSNTNLVYTTSEKKVLVPSDCLSFSYPGKLESWEREGRLYGTVVYFAESFLRLNTNHSGFENEFPFSTFDGDILLLLDEKDALQLKKQAEEMISEMYSHHPDKLEMIRKLLAVYLHKIKRLYFQKKIAQILEAAIRYSSLHANVAVEAK